MTYNLNVKNECGPSYISFARKYYRVRVESPGTVSIGEGKMHREDRIPLWLDCDPGHDDAFAILLAVHHPSLHLLGISTVYGNSSLSHTTQNALSVLQAIGAPHVPVFPGCSKPFCRTVGTAADIHGESGLDGTDLLPKPKRKAMTHCNAIREMRDSLMQTAKQTAWLVVTGTLTNAALLFAVYPEVAGHLKGLSIMGGAIGNGFSDVYMGPEYTDAAGIKSARIGNWTPFAEFNVWCDPEASKAIFSNQDLREKTVLIPLDLTHQACVTKEVRSMFLHSSKNVEQPTTMRRMFNDLLMFFAKTYEEVFGLKDGPPLHDPLAVAVLLAGLKDDWEITFDNRKGERWSIDIITEGEQLGRTVIKPVANGSRIPRSLDLQKFWDALEYCLDRADASLNHGQ